MSPEFVAGALMGVIPVLVAGIVKLLDWYRGRKADAFEQGRKLRQDQLAEYDALFNRLQADLAAKGQQLAAMEVRLVESIRRETEGYRRCSKCEARLEYYESVLLGAGMKFRPWSEVNQDEPPDQSGRDRQGPGLTEQDRP